MIFKGLFQPKPISDASPESIPPPPAAGGLHSLFWGWVPTNGSINITPSPGLLSAWETFLYKWATTGWTHGAGPTAPQLPARLPSSCEQLGAEEDKERRVHPAVGTWLWVTGGHENSIRILSEFCKTWSLVTLSTVTRCRELLLPSSRTEPKARLSTATAFCAEQMSTLGYLSPLPGMWRAKSSWAESVNTWVKMGHDACKQKNACPPVLASALVLCMARAACRQLQHFYL